MPFEKIKAQYDFEQNGSYMLVKTDFEIIEIYCDQPERFFLTENNLIRFINDELLEEYPCENDIHGVYFLPTHKTDIFLESLESTEIIPELEGYYTQDMKGAFSIGPSELSMNSPIKHKNRARYGTSLYGADAATLSELIEAGEQILKLNAMQGYKIATGAINNCMGLLERSAKDRSTTPKSRHYNFWKFDTTICNAEFSDVASGFDVVE